MRFLQYLFSRLQNNSSTCLLAGLFALRQILGKQPCRRFHHHGAGALLVIGRGTCFGFVGPFGLFQTEEFGADEQVCLIRPMPPPNDAAILNACSGL